MLGYTPERVNQLIGRKTKRALPFFLITLPRNLDNLKILDLKTLSYLSIRVEGYDGTAVTDQPKANLLATNIKNNFVENERENDNYNQNDELINTTVNNFLSTPPTSFIKPALPDEIIHYIKHVNAKKAPGRNSHLSIENKVLLYTAVMRPILAYASPVWGYAAKTKINTLDTLQNSLIRMIVKATRYMRNDDIPTPPGFHRSTNRHHSTQQNGKHRFCPAQLHRLSRYGIEDCFYSPDAQRKTPIQPLFIKSHLLFTTLLSRRIKLSNCRSLPNDPREAMRSINLNLLRTPSTYLLAFYKQSPFYRVGYQEPLDIWSYSAGSHRNDVASAHSRRIQLNDKHSLNRIIDRRIFSSKYLGAWWLWLRTCSHYRWAEVSQCVNLIQRIIDARAFAG
ncbi:hypothetical protein TNCV_1884511 [Trichonephila clavipes]|nr:hypothetical protein TNCV_1884511 [Trichonephila clavipes]